MYVFSSKRKTLQKLVAIGFISKPVTSLVDPPRPVKLVFTKSPISILLHFVAVKPFTLFPSQGVSTMSLCLFKRKVSFDDLAEMLAYSKEANNLIKRLLAHFVPFSIVSMYIISYND
tara:strand:+ start:2603 stop:2953 length:351 start_codon:yes stop_codon:yes gene_type:complete